MFGEPCSIPVRAGPSWCEVKKDFHLASGISAASFSMITFYSITSLVSMQMGILFAHVATTKEQRLFMVFLKPKGGGLDGQLILHWVATLLCKFWAWFQ